MDYRLRRISPKYISAGELPADKDTVVTIARITTEDVVGEGGKLSTMGIVYFKGWTKGWCLNSGCGKTIRKMYGAEDDQWIGKVIAIYRATTKVGGDADVPCIRVRPTPPKTTRADPQPAPEDGDPNTALLERVCRELEAATTVAQVDDIVAAHGAAIKAMPAAMRKLANDTRASVLAALAKDKAP